MAMPHARGFTHRESADPIFKGSRIQGGGYYAASGHKDLYTPADYIIIKKKKKMHHCHDESVLCPNARRLLNAMYLHLEPHRETTSYALLMFIIKKGS